VTTNGEAAAQVPQVAVETAEDLRTSTGLQPFRSTGPVVVVAGGASGMEQRHLDAVATLLRGRLVAALDRWRAVVVDGGTDSGVMRLLGRARAEHRATFPLIGVAASGTVVHHGESEPTITTQLEPHHSLVVLVPGHAWGDESRWLSAVAVELAVGKPSVTLLINGGRVAYQDAEHSLAAGRPVVVLAGSGRSSDAISAARSGGSADDRAVRIARSSLVHPAALSRPDHVIRLLAELLQVNDGPDPGPGSVRP
jgi:SLOG in TRPM, prokaryote